MLSLLIAKIKNLLGESLKSCLGESSQEERAQNHKV